MSSSTSDRQGTKNAAALGEFTPDFLSFLDSSPSPFHAVQSARNLLDAEGFTRISEGDDWAGALRKGGKYYLTRNGSSIVAFALGSEWKASSPISIVGAHTDSPCFHVKPHSRRPVNEGYLQIAVSQYGGGQWQTWFDRDLSLAGRVMVKVSSGKPGIKLVHIKEPILRIPTLAIHLHREDNPAFNKEDQLLPIAGLISEELNKPASCPDSDPEPFQALKPLSARHHPVLLDILAQELDVSVESILDFDLCLYDTQKAEIGGVKKEFVLSARLDNLCMSYCALRGLIESVKNDNLRGDSSLRMAVLFDNEEIGSRSGPGADSDFLPSVLRRIATSDTSPTVSEFADPLSSLAQGLSRSLIISADMAHAFHPNFSGKYESCHRPRMNGGPVVKVNANARYATNSIGRTVVAEIATGAKVPLQQFVVRNDSPCGSTIGPFLNSLTGVMTVDIGNPQLSMHSVREMGGEKDVGHAVRLFKAFYQTFGKEGVFQMAAMADE